MCGISIRRNFLQNRRNRRLFRLQVNGLREPRLRIKCLTTADLSVFKHEVKILMLMKDFVQFEVLEAVFLPHVDIFYCC